MAYLEELLPEFRKGKRITNRSRDKSFFVQMRIDNGIINSYGKHYNFNFSDFISDDWELYQEPIDWQYIIDNKCLCCFWDDKEAKVFGYLCRFPEPKDHYLYKTQTHDGFKYFKNCRPVRRDEVTFYEDR